ncbi:MAG: 16S rRNA (cytosine(1402)-N(4))-methyltransferase, partial [Alphaproteobacteria bacterium]|nr:16S rRNA (cytosine(1402)-N(4))-methyltransferase [Alphaproteobacteria bacterium]
MKHIPVLLNDVLNILGDINGKTVVDCTFGAGGYSRAFLERGANVIAFDRDPSVLPTAQKLEQEFGERFEFINEPFSEIRTLLCRLNNSPLGGSRRDKVEPVGGQDNNSPHRIAPRGGSAAPPQGGGLCTATLF